MARISETLRRAAALCAALLLVGAGLTACGGGEPEPSDQTEQPAASEEAAPAEEEAPVDGPTELTGEPLPDGWPTEFLVPYGEVTLVLPIGDGVSVLVEGVDEAQAKGLIDEMVAAGLETTAGVTDAGNGEWVAEVFGTTASGDPYRAAYHFEPGGAGLPKVDIMLTPDQ